MISANAIPRFLANIRMAGVPDKVDANYLKSVGFKNSNDRALIALFKSLGFLDSGGKPTELYRSYRSESADKAKNVLGAAVKKKTYAGLFQTYPDAYRKDDEALTNWIRANTDGGADMQKRALNTFKLLRDAATFDDSPVSAVDVPPVSASDNGNASGNGNVPPAGNGSGQVQHL